MATIYCRTCRKTFPCQPIRSSSVHRITCSNKFCANLKLINKTHRMVARVNQTSESLEVILRLCFKKAG
jgi:hypothetical protein